jgi:hypothetical protein
LDKAKPFAGGIIVGLGTGEHALRSASQGYLPTGPCVVRWLDNKSRMSGDVHVRFREHVGVRFPRVTRLNGGYT